MRGTVITMAGVLAALLLGGCGGDSTPPSGPDDSVNDYGITPPARDAACRVTFTHQINDPDHEYAWHWVAVATHRWRPQWRQWERVMLPSPTYLDDWEILPPPGHLGGGHPMDPMLSPDDTVRCRVPFHDGYAFHSYTTGIDVPQVEGWELDTLWVDDSYAVNVISLGAFDSLRVDDTSVDDEEPLWIRDAGRHPYPLSWDAAPVHELRILSVQTVPTRTEEVVDDTLYTEHAEYHIDMRVHIAKQSYSP